MMDESEAMKMFEEVAGALLNPHIDQWKKQGKKVIGYNCSYFPEEFALAADLIAFKIRGTGCTETSLADSFLGRTNCSFSRSCLENLLQGRYDFLDGAIFTYSCDHMCAAHNNWAAQGKLPLIENIIGVPHTQTEHGRKWFREEFSRIREKFEEHFDVKITDEKLREAITTSNETHSLQKRLYALRNKDQPPITGSQVLSVQIAESSMPRDEYNRQLTTLLEELENQDGIPEFSHRLMVSGSVIDDPALLNIIEEAGAMVVADAFCFGAGKALRGQIKEMDDPLDAIVERYYSQIVCPRMFDGYPERLSFMLDIAKQAKVDGVVLQNIFNCDLHGIDNVMLETDFEENGIPVLTLEREHNLLADAGRIRTRVQAFLEQIRR